MQTKNARSFRMSRMTEKQLDELSARLGTSLTETITIAIDRMYRKEVEMKDKQPTITLNESGYDTGMSFADYCKLAAMHGDDPASHSSDINDFVFVSKSYAQQDSMWDVPDGWPEALPVWMYRPEEN